MSEPPGSAHRHEVATGVQDGRPVAVLRSPDSGLSAAFAPGAGMVGCSLVHDGDELLGLTRGLAAYVERGSTMGIPLLHPWANRLSGMHYEALGRTVTLDAATMPIRLEEHGLPIHGVMAGRPGWSLRTLAASDADARMAASFRFGADELLAAFPFPHTLAVEAVLSGSALTIRTTVTPTGAIAVPISFGWHPYFQLPGAARADWRLSLPARTGLLLDDDKIPTGATTELPAVADEPLGDAVYDDGFMVGEPPVSFSAAAGGRRITVSFLDGYRYAQLFAPAEFDVVCFEPMTAPTSALTRPGSHPVAEPGGAYTAGFSVTVEDD